MILDPGFYDRQADSYERKLRQWLIMKRQQAAQSGRNPIMAPFYAPAPSDVTWAQSAARRINDAQEKAKAAALIKKQQRMAQLAAMPNNRGMRELERIQSGGSLEETAGEKMIRQREAQLAAMPEGRGTVPDKKTVSKAAEQRKRAEEAQRSAAPTPATDTRTGKTVKDKDEKDLEKYRDRVNDLIKALA